MTGHNHFHYAYGFFTNAQPPRSEVDAARFDKLVLLDPVEVSWLDHGLHSRATIECFRKISSSYEDKWLLVQDRALRIRRIFLSLFRKTYPRADNRCSTETALRRCTP